MQIGMLGLLLVPASQGLPAFWAIAIAVVLAPFMYTQRDRLDVTAETIVLWSGKEPISFLRESKIVILRRQRLHTVITFVYHRDICHSVKEASQSWRGRHLVVYRTSEARFLDNTTALFLMCTGLLVVLSSKISYFDPNLVVSPAGFAVFGVSLALGASRLWGLTHHDILMPDAMIFDGRWVPRDRIASVEVESSKWLSATVAVRLTTGKILRSSIARPDAKRIVRWANGQV
jgi:hypothetical protein